MDAIENTVSKNTPVVVGMLTDLLLRNGLRNSVLLLHVCMLWALPSNACCLQSLLGNRSDATVCVGLQHGFELLTD
jgi:hypothetical protein